MLFTGWRQSSDFRMARANQDKSNGKPESLQVRKSNAGWQEELCADSTGRASAASSGSLTIETAFVLPLVLFFLMTFFSLFSALRIQLQVQRALEEAMDSVVKRTVYQTETPLTSQRLNQWILERQVRVELREISEISQLDFAGTKVDYKAEAATVQLQYAVEVQSMFFRLEKLTFCQKSVRKLWTGVEAWGPPEEEKEIWVYVAESGSVYHVTQECSYLRLSIQTVSRDALDELRNASGAKYRACERCRPGKAAEIVYITTQGDRYHDSLTCSGLKRTVKKVRLEEVGGKVPCSRCGTVKETEEMRDVRERNLVCDPVGNCVPGLENKRDFFDYSCGNSGNRGRICGVEMCRNARVAASFTRMCRCTARDGAVGCL